MRTLSCKAVRVQVVAPQHGVYVRQSTRDIAQEQVRLAERAARELVEGRRVHTQELVVSLRNFIREALDLEPVPAGLAIPPQGPTRPSGSGAGGRGRGEGGGGRGSGGGMGGGGGGMGMGMGMGMGLGGSRQDPDA